MAAAEAAGIDTPTTLAEPGVPAHFSVVESPVSRVASPEEMELPQESESSVTLTGVRPPPFSATTDDAVPRLGGVVLEPVEEDNTGKTLTLRRTMFGLPADSTVGANESNDTEQISLGAPGLLAEPTATMASSPDDMAPTLLMTPEKLDAVTDVDIPGMERLEEPESPPRSPPPRKSGSVTLFGMQAAELQLAMQDHTETPHAVIRPSEEEDILVQSDTAEFAAIPLDLDGMDADPVVAGEPTDSPLAGPDLFGLDHAISGLTPGLTVEPTAEPAQPAPVSIEPLPEPLKSSFEPAAPPLPLDATAEPNPDPDSPSPEVRIQSVAPVGGTGPGFTKTETMPAVTAEARESLLADVERPEPKPVPSYAMTGSEVREIESRLPTPAVGAPSVGTPVVGTPAVGTPVSVSELVAWSAPPPVLMPEPPTRSTGGAIRFFQFVAGAVFLASTFLPFEGSVWNGASGDLWNDVIPIALGLAAVALSIPRHVPGLERLFLGLAALAAVVMVAKNAGKEPFDVGGQVALSYILFLAGGVLILLLGIFAIKSAQRNPSAENRG